MQQAIADERARDLAESAALGEGVGALDEHLVRQLGRRGDVGGDGADADAPQIAAFARHAQLQLEPMVAKLEQLADERRALQRRSLRLGQHLCIMRVVAHVYYSR
jgi:hypothetical protein